MDKVMAILDLPDSNATIQVWILVSNYSQKNGLADEENRKLVQSFFISYSG